MRKFFLNRNKKKFNWDTDETVYPEKDDIVVCVKSYNQFNVGDEYQVFNISDYHIWLKPPGLVEMGFCKQFFYEFFEIKE